MNLNVFNAREKLIRAMVKMQSHCPFFSYIVSHFHVSPFKDKNEYTVGIDEKGNFYYSEYFIMSLNNEELIAVIAHECMHMALGHFFRMGNRNKELWNIAGDCVINFMLVSEQYKFPKYIVNQNGEKMELCTPSIRGDVMLMHKNFNVKGKTTEEFYDELENFFKTEKIKDFVGFDIHLFDEKKIEKSEEKKWEKITVEAAVSAKSRGNLPGFAEHLVDNILNPSIDWRSLLLKFITNEIPVDYDNRMPSRRYYGTGIWSPRVSKENLKVFVGVDVSGSTIDERSYFISEIIGILNMYTQIEARLIFWDTTVHEENDYLITRENKEELCELKIKNCNGGTLLSSYTEYCKEKDYKSRLTIFFTDGCIEQNPKLPTGNIIFVLSKNGDDSIVKEYGTVCNITGIN